MFRKFIIKKCIELQLQKVSQKTCFSNRKIYIISEIQIYVYSLIFFVFSCRNLTAFVKFVIEIILKSSQSWNHLESFLHLNFAEHSFLGTRQSKNSYKKGLSEILTEVFCWSSSKSIIVYKAIDWVQKTISTLTLVQQKLKYEDFSRISIIFDKSKCIL